MPLIQISAEGHVDAPPDRVYAILADYHAGHPSVLPRQYFTGLEVLAGGVGAGTRFRFGMRSFGSVRHLTASVSEPEPGRVLVETGEEMPIVTSFTVDPDRDGARVTIATRWDAPGLGGWMMSLLAPGMLRKVYAAELEQLRRVAEAQR
jgi:hypothetical protein